LNFSRCLRDYLLSVFGQSYRTQSYEQRRAVRTKRRLRESPQTDRRTGAVWKLLFVADADKPHWTEIVNCSYAMNAKVAIFVGTMAL